MAKFNILNKAEKVIDYIMIITDKAPRKLRIDIIPELRKVGLNIIKDIVYANYYVPCGDTAQVLLKKRSEYQIDALINLDIVDVISEVCLKRNYITEHQFTYLSTLTYELRQMIKNWIDSDKKRYM